MNSSFHTYENFGHDPRPARQDILLEMEKLLNNEKIDAKNR